MHTPKILIVDDDPAICHLLEIILHQHDYDPDVAVDGEAAIAQLHAARYDLILLDLHMEPVDGFRVMAAARQQDLDVVIILITAYGSMDSAIQALRLGAFDYILKPIVPGAILQQVEKGLYRRRQALRRRRLATRLEDMRQTLDALEGEAAAPPLMSHRFIRSGPLRIDRYHRTALLDDKSLDLTTTEFDLLVCLVETAPQPLTPVELIRRVMGYESGEREASSIVKWHIHHLRHKIELDPARPRYIKTVRYQGKRPTVASCYEHLCQSALA